MNDKDIRVGVFVCDCGSNIAGVVNVPQVVDYAKGLEGVVFADEGRWSCSVDALAAMQTSIKEHKINRVVVAACTPRTHEPLFKATVKEAGVNPYLLEFVSIREQVSWVHMNEPETATQKAKDLVRMAVAKANLIEPLGSITLPVTQSAFVLGGGTAGMTAALAIADQVLETGGDFVCKIFQGGDYKTFTDSVKARFSRQTATRPQSTRKASREVFVIGLEKK